MPLNSTVGCRDVIRSTKVSAQREALSLDKKVRWVLVRRFGSK